ncbi:MAG: nucleoside-diphosphate kinase [Sulfobacillus sp.]
MLENGRGGAPMIFCCSLRKRAPKGARTSLRELAYIMLKPDCLRRGLQEAIAADLLSASGVHLLAVRERTAEAHEILAHCEDLIRRQQADRNIVQHLAEYYVGQPIWAMVVSGSEICSHLRTIIGASDPSTAHSNTIRGKYAIDSFARAREEGRMVHNLIHCSDNHQQACREIDIWFPNGIRPDDITRALTLTDALTATVCVLTRGLDSRLVTISRKASGGRVWARRYLRIRRRD